MNPPDSKNDDHSNAEPLPFWVTIGASAGGLDALKELLSGLSPDTSAIYLIAQHLDPKHPTILKDLLARITDLPIHLVDQDTTPQVGQIYIVSPGHNAVVRQGRIQLSPAAVIGPKPSINLLLESLAEDTAEHTIAIILSGTGSDGAQGVTAIKAASGLVISQDEASAKYSGMPNAAMETGCVDLSLPPSKIAAEIKGYIDSAGKTLTQLNLNKKTSTLEKIFQRLLDQTGYDFSGYKLKTVHRRIARRMAVHKIVTLDDYLTLLNASSQEVENLFKDMLISVTDFFRDPKAFEDLKIVIDKLVMDYQDGEQIRVWVPGCANGEEAYSIAILFQQARLKHHKEVNFQIFASDIDEFALTQGRRGQYSELQIKNIPTDALSQYFFEKDQRYWVHKSIRDHVVFARQNLVMDPPFSKLDLISCRNVMIYFSLALQKQVLQTFHFALKPDGFLFLGKSESASSAMPELFDPYIKSSQIFQRKKTSLNNRADHIRSAVSVAKTKQSPTSNAPLMLQDNTDWLHRLDSLLLDQMVPTAIVVDASGQVLHIRGDVSTYLSFPQGKIDTNILTLVRDDIKVDVRALLQKAKRDGQASTQALFFNNTEAEKALFITIQRISPDKTTSTQSLFVISFTQVDLSEAFISGTGLLEADQTISNDNLRKEVAIFKERLQTSVEELETTNEELQSTNEELQSANEELQSANEELQTANEELQSTNEELSTVNQELEVKTYELEQVNNDLQNMLDKMNESIVLVDNRLRLLRYTRFAADILALQSADIGQTITTLGLNIDIPNLRQELLNVIETETESLLKVRKEAIVYQLRLVPYKSDALKVVGVMLFFETLLASSNRDQSRDDHQTLHHLAAYVPFTVITIDETGIITFVSPTIKALLGYTPEEVLHKNISHLMPEPYRQHHNDYLSNYLSGQSKGLMHQWRDVTALSQDGRRLLLKLRVENTSINGDPHFLGYLIESEKLHELE